MTVFALKRILKIVTGISKSTSNTEVAEIEMLDISSGMFVSSGSTFADVCGAIASKLRDNQVKLLCSNRFNGVLEALLKNEELEACRNGLEAFASSADLTVYELGRGKIIV